MRKVASLLPVVALVAACSTGVPPAPPNSQSAWWRTYSKIDECVKWVEVIMRIPYVKWVTLEMMRPDRCADPMGYMLYHQKLKRKGRLILDWSEKISWVKRMVLHILVTQWTGNTQEVLIDGKRAPKNEEKSILARIDELEKLGSIEKD